MRELSEHEKEFVRRSTEESGATVEGDETLSVRTKSDRRREERVTKFKTQRKYSPVTWLFAGLISLLILSTGAATVIFLRAKLAADAFLGAGTFERLATEGTDEQFDASVREAGMGWILDLMRVYEYRIPILIGVLALAALIVVGYALLDPRFRRPAPSTEEGLDESSGELEDEDHEDEYDEYDEEEEYDDDEEE